MGAGWSAATGLHVQCDKEEYVAGDTVRAVVALNVVGNPIKLEGIELELIGSERTRWDDGRHQYGGTFQFASERLTLGDSFGTFVPGQYQWALVLRLPLSLPGIFKASAVRSSGQVKYELQATGHTKGALHRALRSQAHFLRVLAAPPTHAPVPVERSAEYMQECCCFDRGAISARLALDRDWALRGEEVGVTIEVDNQSSLDVEFLVVSLWSAWQLRGVPHPGLLGDKFRDEGQASPERVLEGVPAHSAVQGDKAWRIKFKLPADLQPTHVGPILEVRYHIRLTLQMGKFRTDMHLKAPLRVFIPRRGTKEGATAGAAFPAAAAVPAEGQAPFLAEPPPFWKPMTVHGPAAWEVGDAPTLPQDALRADATFFVKSSSNS